MLRFLGLFVALLLGMPQMVDAKAGSTVRVELSEEESEAIKDEIDGGAFVGYGPGLGAYCEADAHKSSPKTPDRRFSFSPALLMALKYISFGALVVALVVCVAVFVMRQMESVSGAPVVRKWSLSEMWNSFLRVLRSLSFRDFKKLFSSHRAAVVANSNFDSGAIPVEDLRNRNFEDELAIAKEAGNYREAVRIIYLSTLVALEAKGAVSCDVAKTAWEYFLEYESNAPSPAHAQSMRQLSIVYLSALYDTADASADMCDAALACRNFLTSEVPQHGSSAGSVLMALVGLMVLCGACSCSKDEPKQKINWRAEFYNESNLHNNSGVALPLARGDFNDIMRTLYDDWGIQEHYTSVAMQKYESNLFLHSVSDGDTPSFSNGDPGLHVGVLCKRLSKGKSVIVAAERLAFYNCDLYDEYGYVINLDSCPDYESIIEGPVYSGLDIMENVTPSGNFQLSSIECGGKVWQFPSVFSTCRINLRRLQSFVYNVLTPAYLRRASSARFKIEVLATIDHQPVAVRVKASGGGALTIVSIPLLFTNYGVYADGGSLFPLINGLFEAGFSNGSTVNDYRQVSVVPVVKAYVKDPYIIVQPSLTPAHGARFKNKSKSNRSEDNGGSLRDLLLIILALLFMLWLARRRTSVIPVVEPPRNKSLDLLGFVANVYERRVAEDFAISSLLIRELLRKRLLAFEDNVYSRYHVHLDNLDVLANAVAFAHGGPAEAVRANLDVILGVCHSVGDVSWDDYRRVVDLMESIES